MDDGVPGAGWEWLRELFERVDIGVFSVDFATGQVTRCNEAYARILGYESAAAALGSNVAVHYADPNERAETINRFMADPRVRATGVMRFEGQRKRVGDGAIVDGLITVVLVKDEAGRPVRLDCLLDDIGERKRAEKVFRHSEERFRILFESSPLGMALTDPRGILTRVNPVFCRLMGRDSAAICSHRLDEFLAPEQSGTRSSPQFPPGDGEKTPGQDWCFLRPDGSSAWANVTWSWLRDDAEALSGVVILQDVTERRRMETTLLRLEKLESLGVLAGGIAHDFNNILTAVLGNLSLAATVPECHGRVREYLESAEQAAHRARELTRQLITFAKGGSPVKEVASLADVAREAVAMCLRGSGVTVRMDVAPDLHLAEFDPGQIGQVCHNLMVNAAQAMPGGGTVDIRLRNEEVGPQDGGPLAPGRYVRLDVADQGPGIPVSAQRRIFDPYFSTKPNGVGLGLATVHSIIRRHGGHVEAHNAPGSGAVFSFLLPAAAGRIATRGPAATGPAPGSSQGVRILVMDDEECVRRVASQILERAGYEVQAVAHGEAAVQAWIDARDEGRPFAAVVLDLTIRGGLGGVATLEQLRVLDPDVRALVASGYSEDPVMSRYREHGFRAAVGKPFTAAEMQGAIRRVIAD